MARPSKFTQKLADAICEGIAKGQSLTFICDSASMPGYTTVMAWLRANDEFRNNYARAREDQGDADADQIKDILRDVLKGLIDHQAGRVAIDALKWTASKRAPKKYGEKIEHEVSGEQVIRIKIGGAQ